MWDAVYLAITQNFKNVSQNFSVIIVQFNVEPQNLLKFYAETDQTQTNKIYSLLEANKNTLSESVTWVVLKLVHVSKLIMMYS